jgi:membrane-associated HD superfamily phosphohydrolase
LGIEFQTHEWEEDEELREKYTRYLEFKNEELKKEQDSIKQELKKVLKNKLANIFHLRIEYPE